MSWYMSFQRRKKEHQFQELCGEEGLVAAQRKKMSTCCLVHLCEDYILGLHLCLTLAWTWHGDRSH